MMNKKKNIQKTRKHRRIHKNEIKIKTSLIINANKIDNYKYSSREKFIQGNQKIKIKYKNQKNLKSIFKIFFNGIGLLLFIISYYFYYLSLDKCLQGEDECTKKLKWIQLRLNQYIISVVIITILFALIFYNIISKLHLIHFLITFICFYKYSHSVYFHDHGAYNLIGLVVVIILSLIFLLILKLFFVFLKNKYRYKFVSILLLIFFYNALIDPTNCNDWPKGLNNTYIENDKNKYGCQIRFPKKCQYKVIEYTQDLSFLSRKSCSNKKKNARKNILEFSKSPNINENTTKFGFPLTNNEMGLIDGKDNFFLTNYTRLNLLDMDKQIPPEFPKPEYIVDFSKDPLGELIINLNFNETLSKERKKYEVNSTPYSDNILVLFMDSVSRVNAMRKLKKTLNFFEQFISYKGGHNQKYPKENFHSFQFFKYHRFKFHTTGNFPKLFYGNDRNAKVLVRISKYLKENGYVTGYAADYCQKDNIRNKHNLTFSELYDHQLLLCDPNVDDLNSATKRCLYGQINSYHLYEYINQFWRKYQNNRKYSLIVVNDGHEGTLELVKYTDDIIYNFLNSLYKDNLLKDTSIFLLSDHGCDMPSGYYIYQFYRHTSALPMLFIIINDRKNIDYNKQYFYIQENQQTFITAYDIYNTISNLIYGDNYINIENKTDLHDTPKSPFGKSLLEKINAKKRKPKLYKDMETHICV